MGLMKTTTIDEIKVYANSQIEVCEKVEILDDGISVSSSFHRHVVAPGDDYSQEDPKVQAICAAVQTSEVVAAYQAAQEANKLQVLTPEV
jgi:hypothetical protein